MRRKLVCRIAATLPQIIDTSGSTVSMGSATPDTCEIANSRSAANSTPPLTTVAMNAVTGTLAPSYASGAQPWNGTIAALTNNAARIMTTPAAASGSEAPRAIANTSVESEPLQPYSSATPIRNVAVAVPPSTRYLSAASALSARSWASSTSAYTGSDSNSI